MSAQTHSSHDDTLQQFGKRQIPSGDQDEKLLKNAARREKLPTAEWARRILRREALRAKSGFTWAELFQKLHADTGLDFNGAKVELFLSRLASLPFTPETAKRYGTLRASLEKAGKTIGPADLLIAATALEHGLTLITRSDREFGRIPGLAVEVW